MCLKTSDVKVETIDSKSGSVPNVASMLQSSDVTCKKKTVSIQGAELLNKMLVGRGAGWRNGEQVTNFSCDKNWITKEEPVMMRNYMQEVRIVACSFMQKESVVIMCFDRDRICRFKCMSLVI